MEVIFTKKARNDLHNFFYYSKINNQEYIEDLIKHSELISHFPYIGKVVDSINRYKIRQLIHKKHRILYTIYNKKIYILSFIHFSQNFNLKRIFNLFNFPET